MIDFTAKYKIKLNLTLKKKINFSVSFMLLFTKIRFLPTRRFLRQQINFFLAISFQFVCLRGLILVENAVLHLENEAKSYLKQYKMDPSSKRFVQDEGHYWSNDRRPSFFLS